MEISNPDDRSIDNDSKDDPSDDDLLSPTTFLYASIVHKDLRTPEKVRTPSNNDLSPLIKIGEKISKKKNPTRYAFGKLIAEKAAQDETDTKLLQMDEELKKIETGEILNLILKESIEDASEVSELKSSQEEDMLPQHQLELQNVKDSFQNDFADGFPGEEVFIYKSDLVDLSAPRAINNILGISDLESDSGPSKKMINSDIKELLTCGFLIDMALFKDQNENFIDWLLSCICHSDDPEVIEGAFKAYWIMVTSSRGAEEKFTWYFNTKSFLRLLVAMGADETSLFATEYLQNKFQTYFDDVENSRKELMQKRNIGEDGSSMMSFSVQTLIKCYTYSLKEFPEKYSRNDIICSICIACRLCLDLAIIAASWEIQVLIAYAIDCYDDLHWSAEIEEICKHISDVTANHCNRLQIVEMIPITNRGKELKRWLALKFLTMSCILPINDLKLSFIAKVLRIVTSIHTDQDTDFHELYSVISFIGYCISEDAVTASEKKKLEDLITTLRLLNGGIKDPGGRFMNRTKVKDLILRVISRLTFICQELHTQSNLDGFFGSTKSSFKQLKFEKLEDRGVDPENDDCQDVDDNTKERQMCIGNNLPFEDITDEDTNGYSVLSEDPLIDLERKHMAKMAKIQ